MVFEWDPVKEHANLAKHGIDFSTVPVAFEDPKHQIFPDSAHSAREERFYCIGHDGKGILTVRFVLRAGTIRVIGAGYWRKQKQAYEKANREL